MEQMAEDTGSGRVLGRINVVAAAWRFTYLPGTTISFDSVGPMITSDAQSWGSAWSAATLSAVDGPDDDLRLEVERDLHGLLVQSAAELICDAFYIDGNDRGDCIPPAAEPSMRPQPLTLVPGSWQCLLPTAPFRQKPGLPTGSI